MGITNQPNNINQQSTPLAGISPKLRIPLFLIGLILLGLGYYIGENNQSTIIEPPHWTTADVLAEAHAQVTCHTPPMVKPDISQFLPSDYHINNPHIPFVVWPEHIPSIIPMQAFPPKPSTHSSIKEADDMVSLANESNTLHQKVPSVIHYTFGLTGDDSPTIPYYQYLAIRSAIVVLKPKVIMFHYFNEPRGPWWDRLKDLPQVIHVKPRQFNTIFENEISEEKSKSDVIRLEALIRWGGIFLDPDVYVIRDFLSAGLLNEPVVMGMESQLDMSKHELDPSGLNNGVILSEPNSRFIRDWLNTYESFNQTEPKIHSLEIPWKLARMNPSYVTVLNRLGLFWPLYDDDAINMVHSTNPEAFNFDLTAQFTYKSWEDIASDKLDILNPSNLKTIKTPFTRMARRFAQSDDEHHLQGYMK